MRPLIYRNLTKNMSSYSEQRPILFRIMSGGILLVGIGFASVLFVLGNPPIVPIFLGIVFLATSLYFLYRAKQYKDAIRLIENYT